MAITRGQMQRQLRRGGGIMNITPREQFGLGSSLKKFVRKVIPNEVSKVATVAAPFVAPFNPQLAAAMAGIGSFDQTGSIGDSLKRAGITYAGGQLARAAGGAGFQDPSMSLQGFTNLTSPTTGATIFGGFGGPTGSPVKSIGGIGPEGLTGSEVGGEITLAESAGGTSASPTILAEQMSEASLTPRTITETVTKSAPKSVIQAIKNQDYFEAAKLAAEKGTKALFTTPITDAQGNVTGSKLDKTMLLAAGTAGLSYLDAKKLADEIGEDIGTEEEYDEATKEEKRAEYAGYLTNFFEGKKDGGRIGFDNGGDVMTDAEREQRLIDLADYYMERGLSEQEAYEAAAKQLYADGGRVSFRFGEKVEDKEGILSMMDKDKEDEDMLMVGVGNVMKLFTNERTGFDRAGFEDMLIQYSDSGAKAKGVKLMNFALDFLGISGMKDGGRIGYMFGDKVEDEEGIMSMSKDKEDENTKMAYFPGDVFSKEEVRRLFSDRSLTTNQDRKDLYKILMNPGMYPEAERALIKMLRGNKEGGRIGFESGANKEYKFMELIEDDTDEKEKLINALLDNAREKFPEASEEDIFNFVMSKAAPMSSLMVDGKFVKSTDIETPSIKLSRDMGGPRYDFLMGGEVPVRKNKAGIEELDYRQSGGFVPVGVKEKADDVPAMLSKNEFVLTADAVRGIGGGDVEKGAEKLYGVMKQAEKVGRA